MQALRDGGSIDEEAAAKGAADIRVELIEGELGLRERTRKSALNVNSFTLAGVDHKGTWVE